jgi:hypothetical protein
MLPILILISDCVVNLVFSQEHNLNQEDRSQITNSFLDCPEGEFCWPKCCDSTSILNMKQMTCQDTNDSALLQAPEIFDFHFNDKNYPVLTLLPNQSITPIDSFGTILSNNICNKSLNFIYPRAFVTILSDGRLYVDNQKNVEIYETGFCLEKFFDRKWKISSFSAFICFPFEPVISLPSPNKAKINKTACHDVFDNQVHFSNAIV